MTYLPGLDGGNDCPRAFLLFADGTEMRVHAAAPWPACAGKITLMLDCPPGLSRPVTGARIETCWFTAVFTDLLQAGDQLAVVIDGVQLQAQGLW